jgi:exopolyphosphatase/guanosine-5'-triphosphate,3'-diphosphate pyrophosphatase
MFKKFIVFLLLVVCLTAIVTAEVVTRAAFDIGSGKVKVQISDVDTDTGSIVKTVFTDSIKVPVKEDLDTSEDKILNETSEAKLMNAIAILIVKCEPFSPHAFSGIATEAFRQAKNGKEVLDRISEELGFQIHLISQTEEARLGFLSATIEMDKPMSPLVVWDIGGGSFQLSTEDKGDFYAYNGQFGKVSVKNLILTEIQKRPLSDKSPNPMSLGDVRASMTLLRKKLDIFSYPIRMAIEQSNGLVAGIGAMHSHLASVNRNGVYTKDDVWNLLISRLKKTDEELSNDPIEQPYCLTDLIFLYTAMDAYGIKSVQHVKTVGGTAALLLSEQYWINK